MRSYRFYSDFAPWWPLISPVADYEQESVFAASLLNSASIPVREVLELGSGGGHSAAHLKQHFEMSLVDLAPEMIELSKRLNPTCEHRIGDMRCLRLDRRFDAVFVHDAVDYMTTELELRQAIDTAFAHCRPGGIAVFMPDHILETFEPGTSHGGGDGSDGRGVRYLEWRWDPDPKDTWVVNEYAFLFRSPEGVVEMARETHRTGLFSLQVWLGLLSDAGFRPRVVTEVTREERSPRQVFVGLRGT